MPPGTQIDLKESVPHQQQVYRMIYNFIDNMIPIIHRFSNFTQRIHGDMIQHNMGVGIGFLLDPTLLWI